MVVMANMELRKSVVLLLAALALAHGDQTFTGTTYFTPSNGNVVATNLVTGSQFTVGPTTGNQYFTVVPPGAGYPFGASIELANSNLYADLANGGNIYQFKLAATSSQFQVADSNGNAFVQILNTGYIPFSAATGVNFMGTVNTNNLRFNCLTVSTTSTLTNADTCIVVSAAHTKQTLPAAVLGENFIIIAQADTTLEAPAGDTINGEGSLELSAGSYAECVATSTTSYVCSVTDKNGVQGPKAKFIKVDDNSKCYILPTPTYVGQEIYILDAKCVAKSDEDAALKKLSVISQNYFCTASGPKVDDWVCFQSLAY